MVYGRGARGDFAGSQAQNTQAVLWHHRRQGPRVVIRDKGCTPNRSASFTVRTKRRRDGVYPFGIGGSASVSCRHLQVIVSDTQLAFLHPLSHTLTSSQAPTPPPSMRFSGQDIAHTRRASNTHEIALPHSCVLPHCITHTWGGYPCVCVPACFVACFVPGTSPCRSVWSIRSRS